MKTSSSVVFFMLVLACPGTSSFGGFPMAVPLYQAKAEFFRTLGHPARIRILELLSERDHAVHELLERIAIEPSNLSQQLAVLRRTSLVVSHRTSGEVVYSVSVPEVRDLLLAARSILSGIIASQGDLEAELAVPDASE
jgi:DNA-binding transcriptional ArsR family regulator